MKEPENKLPPKLTEQKEEEEEHEGNIHEEKINENEEEEEKEKKELNERQEYLEKMMKDKYNIRITNETGKTLENVMKDIKEDYKKDKFNFNNISRNVDKILEKNESISKESLFNDEKNMISKRNMKKLKELKNEKEHISLKIKNLENKRNFLTEEGINNLNEVDKNIKLEELKTIKKGISEYNSKLNEIEYNMKNIIAEESSFSKENKIKEFINNFERDKEIIEIQSKKYLKKYKEKKDQIKKKEKEILEIEKKEKLKLIENEKMKNEIIKDKTKERQLKEKEKREQIKKLAEEKEKETQEKLKKLQEEKKFEDRSNLKENDYLFNKYEEKYLKNKENKILNALSERKKKYQPIMLIDELKDFRKKIDKKHNEIEKKHKEEKKNLIEEWKSRNKELKKYKTSIFHNYENENQTLSEEEKKLNKKKSYEKKLLYSQNNIIRPEESEKLRKIREENIRKTEKKLDFKRIKVKKNKSKIQIKNNYNWDLKLDEIDVNDPLGTSAQLQKALIKKPKKIFFFSDKKIIDKPKIKIDYLQEFKNEKTDSEEKVEDKWKKNKKNNSLENLENMKIKADYLENKAIQNENLLRINGGVKNNISLGKKVSNLLINSIHTKLTIIDSMGNK